MAEKYYDLPEIDERVSRSDLEEALGELNLNPTSKKIFRMGYGVGMRIRTNPEIARELGLSEGHVKTVRTRVVCSLKSALCSKYQ